MTNNNLNRIKRFRDLKKKSIILSKKKAKILAERRISYSSGRRPQRTRRKEPIIEVEKSEKVVRLGKSHIKNDLPSRST